MRRRMVLAMGLLTWFSGGRARAGEAPTAKPTFAHERTIDGLRLLVDRGPQVIALDVPEDRAYDFDASGGPAKAEAPLRATPLGGRAPGGMVSASLLAAKAKQFDDGLYAAVDLAAESGAGRFVGKARLLSTLAGALAGAAPDPAVTTLVAAARLGGVSPTLPPALDRAVRAAITAFDADEVRSKPLAFYTWSPTLTAIFRQDRMLQAELEGAGTAAIVRALAADEVAAAAYAGYLDLVARLTNPLVAGKPDLRPLLADGGAATVPAKGLFFFPPSRAHETELVKRLYGDAPPPDDFSLADEMARRIRAKQLSLEPSKDSGWYDWQTWALETLAAPERGMEAFKLKLSDAYKAELLALFKGLLALTRETHVKQLEVPECGCCAEPPAVHVRPELRVEPLATYYLRRALGYRFVRSVLETSFGQDGLASMRRQGPEGPSLRPLGQELAELEALFFGAYACACEDLGMAADADAGAAAALPRFLAWREALAADADLARDARMMVPLFVDVARRKTKVLVFLGWADRPLSVSFATPPTVALAPGQGGRLPAIEYDGAGETLVYPVTAELYVDRLRDRAEVRAICDAHTTRSAILRALE